MRNIMRGLMSEKEILIDEIKSIIIKENKEELLQLLNDYYNGYINIDDVYAKYLAFKKEKVYDTKF